MFRDTLFLAAIHWDLQWRRDRDGLGESLYLAVLNKFPATKASPGRRCQAMFLCPLSLPAGPLNDPRPHDQIDWQHHVFVQPTEPCMRIVKIYQFVRLQNVPISTVDSVGGEWMVWGIKQIGQGVKNRKLSITFKNDPKKLFPLPPFYKQAPFWWFLLLFVVRQWSWGG